MWHGVHARPEVEELSPLGTNTAQQVVIIADPGIGPVLDPWVMEGERSLKERYSDGRFPDIGWAMPVGSILVGYPTLQSDRRPLYEKLMGLEAKLYCFDGIPVDVPFLDELAEFIQAKQDMGEWIQVVVESPVPMDKAQRESLLDLASTMSVSTLDGVIEDGRQISLVISQYDGAAVDFTVALSRTNPGDTIESFSLKGKVTQEIHRDWLGCYAEAGIIGFLSGETASPFAAVNLVQGGSPYRQLMATRVLQWYLSEWMDQLRFIPGESIELGLYETQRVTEALIVKYRQAGHISDATYGISFSAESGEINCDIVLYPFYGVEGINGVGVARVEKG